MLLCLLSSGAADLQRSRRHVWGSCFLPTGGNTTTPFTFYVNTNHPVQEGLWTLQISGVTELTLGSSNSTAVNVTHPSCVGVQPHWYAWGPVLLNKGVNLYQFFDIGDGDSFLETGPDVQQGGLSDHYITPCYLGLGLSALHV